MKSFLFSIALLCTMAGAAMAQWSDDGVTTETQRLVVIDPSTGGNRVLTVSGPMAMNLTVNNQQGEIFLMTLTGVHDTTSDVFGVVVRNQVLFDVTNGANASGGGYFESRCGKSAGANLLTCTGLEAYASGGDSNYSFHGLAGTLRNDGPGTITGPLSLYSTISQVGNGAINLSGPTVTTGLVRTSSSLEVGTTSELHGAVTMENTLRVNGPTANLLAALVYEADVTGSGAPIKMRETEAYVTDRLTNSGPASLITGVTIVSGSGVSDTLGNGTKDGQVKRLIVTSGSGTLTPSALCGGSSYSWTGPAALTLVWDAVAAKWNTLAVNAMTLNP